ncbi:MAG: hypothetical protein FD153_1496 [Rhodospirillaceae bacterium]|nr:MAG: hypothetical protein FD153_1496 [Rhodospirillaceae bacterium]
MMPTSDDLAASEVREEQVVAYLQDHPDLLFRYPDLILATPSRWQDTKVVDLQHVMINRLREELDSLRGCADALLQTTRSNMSTQERTHRAVLALLGADSFADLCRVVSEDFPVLLAVDVAVLGLEPGLAWPVASLRCLGHGDTDRFLSTRETVLRDNQPGDPFLFGEAAGAVRSDALVRLRPGSDLPQGVLALGACAAGAFHAGQGTELLMFLGRVLEQCVRRWAPPAP